MYACNVGGGGGEGVGEWDGSLLNLSLLTRAERDGEIAMTFL